MAEAQKLFHVIRPIETSTVADLEGVRQELHELQVPQSRDVLVYDTEFLATRLLSSTIMDKLASRGFRNITDQRGLYRAVFMPKIESALATLTLPVSSVEYFRSSDRTRIVLKLEDKDSILQQEATEYMNRVHNYHGPTLRRSIKYSPHLAIANIAHEVALPGLLNALAQFLPTHVSLRPVTSSKHPEIVQSLNVQPEEEVTTSASQSSYQPLTNADVRTVRPIIGKLPAGLIPPKPLA